MSKAIDILLAAQKRAMAIRPKVGGFPVLAETLRAAGVTKNIWHLPSCQSLYLTQEGPIVQQMKPLMEGTQEVPRFDQDALIAALRANQAGKTTFPQFLEASWKAGVVHYIVDFEKREVAYCGCNSEQYVEKYPAISLKI